MDQNAMETSPLPDELVIAQQAREQTTEKDTEAENKTEETPASEPVDDADADESETEDEEGSDADDDSEDDDADAEEADDQPVKKKTRAQRRKERQARIQDQRDAEHRQLQQELAALKAQIEAKPTSEAIADAPPKEEDFEDFADYVSAQAEYKANKTIEARLEAEKKTAQANAEQAAMASKVAEFEAGIDAIRDNYEDYDEVVFDSSLTLSPAIAEVLLELDRGPDLVYRIASDPKVRAKLSAMSKTKVAIELGRMEAELTLPKARKATKAPEPIKPLKGKSTPVEKDPDDMSMDEYIKWREKNGK